jgi:opacity protein-like surface antigen
VDTTLPGPGKVTSARTSFAWAAMAGVAYQIDPNWVIDVGYRYLALGDVPTSRETSLPGDLTNWKQLSAQEVRFGLRLLLH